MLTGFTPGVPLAAYTTFQVGGPAEYFAEATSVAELRALLAGARQADQPVTILGGGSNVLVADAGVRGCVIKNSISEWSVEASEATKTVLLTVGAGDVFDDVVAKTVVHGWWGLENLSHIPGSVGATPVQNVGAYGVEVANRIIAVEAIHKTSGEVHTFAHADCGFGYRDSWFKTSAGRAFVITRVTYELSSEPTPVLSYRDLATLQTASAPPTLADVRTAIIAIRAGKFPDWHTVGTAGSFFKNPIISRGHYERLAASYPALPQYPVSDTTVKVPLGWILEHICHVKGTEQRGVGSFKNQALVLVRTGDATATDIAAFADTLAAAVRAATDITPDWEVTWVN